MCPCSFNFGRSENNTSVQVGFWFGTNDTIFPITKETLPGGVLVGGPIVGEISVVLYMALSEIEHNRNRSPKLQTYY